ncbi:MAG: GNAT family N-acyltransferase [Bacteroidota bacterium]
MKKLRHTEDFLASTNLHKLKRAKTAHPLLQLTGIGKLETLVGSLTPNEGLDFVNALFDQMEIEIVFDPQELQRIPKKGPFITISNHPFGAIDGLILLKLLAPLRSDYKIIASFFLQHLKPIHSHLIFPQTPNQIPKAPKKQVLNKEGYTQALAHLEQGMGLGLFPAGEVSTLQPGKRQITDQGWERQTLKLIQKAAVPIVPIYFQGSNSAIFHLLGMVNPKLSTAMLPAELFRKKQKAIRVRIGNRILSREVSQFKDLDQFGRFLRAKTYALGSALEVRKFYKPKRRPKLRRAKAPQAIIDPIPKESIKAELESLRSHNLLFTQQNFEVFNAYSTEIPHILQELGRLREITFREVGEGTNEPLDTDEFDLYYYHLFIWDKEEEAIVGAYRIGKGDEILEKFGKKGFYTHSLFRIDDGFLPILSQAIELGRSFILKSYQQKRLPLFLLWKGIVYFLKQHPESRYIIGPVSISNSYTTVSRSFIVAFIEKYYFDQELAAYITPRHAFRMKKREPVDTQTLLKGAGADLKKIDKIVSDIEPSHMPLPILLKKYISQNARIIGFNVDPKFNDALDGLMIVDIMELPETSVYHQEDGK